MAFPEVDFSAVRAQYAKYASGGLNRYRLERYRVLVCIRSNRTLHGVKRSRYYQHALAGLRQGL